MPYSPVLFEFVILPWITGKSVMHQIDIISKIISAPSLSRSVIQRYSNFVSCMLISPESIQEAIFRRNYMKSTA